MYTQVAGRPRSTEGRPGATSTNARRAGGPGAKPPDSSAFDMVPATDIARWCRTALDHGLDPVAFSAAVVLLAYHRAAQRAIDALEAAQAHWRALSRRAADKRDHVGECRFQGGDGRWHTDEPRRAKAAREAGDARDRQIAAGIALQKAVLHADRACEAARLATLELKGLVDEEGGDVAESLHATDDEWKVPEAPKSWKGPDRAKPLRVGPFVVLRRTDLVWILIDERLPLGSRTVDVVGPWLREANERALDRGAREGFRQGEGWVDSPPDQGGAL